MIRQTFSDLNLWQFEQLLQYKNIIHFVSGRHGGVSQGEVGTLNLGFKVADTPENVIENRYRITQTLGIEADQLVFPSQTHSDRVQRVNKNTSTETLTETDALITNIPNICVCVMSADCVPVLVYDPVEKAIGAVHAGWRGTVSKILTKTIKAMQDHFGTRPENLIVGIGPSISPQIYQVGAEVIGAVEQAFGNKSGLISQENGNGQGFFNLWEANRRQLQAMNVADSSVEIAGICTYQHSNDFFSARKSLNKAGRFAAGIMLKG